MMSLVNRPGPAARLIAWRGRSGRLYALLPERIDSFSLSGDGLYLMAKGSNVLWAGGAGDVIADQQSRARFRLALVAADRVFRVAEERPDPTERMTTIWDLEGAEPQSGAAAA